MTQFDTQRATHGKEMYRLPKFRSLHDVIIITHRQQLLHRGNISSAGIQMQSSLAHAVGFRHALHDGTERLEFTYRKTQIA
jgi:hypothetical protein